MQVGCKQCGATYEFEAAAIPAAGYDAQCTGCGSVFFVAPEAPAETQIAVTCTSCGAVYQFAASAIPAGGYDAQCTQCRGVFFVSPTGTGPSESASAALGEQMPGRAEPSVVPPAPSAADLSPSASAALGEQMPGRAEPSVVSPAPSAADLSPSASAALGEQMPGQAEPSVVPLAPSAADLSPPASAALGEQMPGQAEPSVVPPAPSAADLSPPAGAALGEQMPGQSASPAPPLEHFVDSAKSVPTQGVTSASPGTDAPVELGAPKSRPPEEPALLGPPKGGPEEGDPELHEMMALSADLGEPAPLSAGASLEEDFERIMARKRTRLRVVLGVLAAIVAYSLATYVAAPRVFDLTVGKLVGVKLTVDPRAKTHVARGVEVMYSDTAAAYDEAIAQFEAALEIDPKYPRAIAVAGLAHLFRGFDVQERGREVFAEGTAAVAESKALEQLPKNRRTQEVETRIAALRKAARDKSDGSGRLFEAGGKEVSTGYDLIRSGLEHFKDVPILVEAAGIYYSADRDAVRRAEEYLRYAVETRYGPDEKLRLDDPPDVWTPFLQGLVNAQGRDKDDPKRAREAFRSVLAKEPRFQRARYELFRLLDRTGAKDEARVVAKEILAAVPDHEKATRYLARPVETTHIESAEQHEPPPPKPTKGKKRRKRRR